MSVQDIQQIPGTFPNPPITSVTGNVTVALAPTGSGISFDTGPQAVTYDASIGAYTFNGNVYRFNNLAGSYTLVTGGQTYTGSFTYQLSIVGGAIGAFTSVSTVGYPNSLSLSGLGGYAPFGSSPITYRPRKLAGVTGLEPATSAVTGQRLRAINLH